MLRLLLQYTLTVLILFQSWHGVLPASAVLVAHDTVVQKMEIAVHAQLDTTFDCQETPHKKICSQACAMLHALLRETVYTVSAALSLHFASDVLPLTSISHRPLLPPPMMLA